MIFYRYAVCTYIQVLKIEIKNTAISLYIANYILGIQKKVIVSVYSDLKLGYIFDFKISLY